MRILKIRKRNLFRTLITGFGEFDFWRRCQMPAPMWILDYYNEARKATKDGTIYRFTNIAHVNTKSVLFSSGYVDVPSVEFNYNCTFYDDSLGNVFK